MSTKASMVVDRPIGAPAAKKASRRPFWNRRVPGFGEGLMGLSLLAGPANVIMQLANPGVGYGVLESRVESGRIDRHPIKRARTTFAYLAVATWGSDKQKSAYRREVNKAHVQVTSTSDSPVKYNAMDPNLQLWVAACLYKGSLDIYRMFIGDMDDETADQHYRDGMALATTLQVTPEMWPADRPAFDKYWEESLEKVHIDDAVRSFLYPIAVARLRGLQFPGFLQNVTEEVALLITTGFLPQRFRDEMHFEWNESKQRQFDALMGLIRFGNNLAPKFVRAFPFNVVLYDLDWRMRTGRPLV